MLWETSSLTSFLARITQRIKPIQLIGVKMGSHAEKAGGLGSQSDDRVDVEQLDRAAAPEMHPSFAHLDEKAILRKVRRALPLLGRPN